MSGAPAGAVSPGARASGDGPDLTPFGIAIGHATDVTGATGCTVVRGTAGALRGAVAVLGRAVGARELGTLDPSALAGRVDAVLLTGGSAYGLDAAAGVMRWMEERGRGFDVGAGVVPIVPAAVIFDLAPLGRFDARPTAAMAYAACEAATTRGVAEGSVGAGTGATVGKGAGVGRAMKGGVGLAMARGGGAAVAALAVVNALGDVRDAAGRIIAGARADGGGFVDAAAAFAAAAEPGSSAALRHTTLAVVAADVSLDRVALAQLARAAGGALYRRITPCGTAFDGDVVFALCPQSAPAGGALQLEALAVRALEDAIERAVRAARGRDGVPGLADAEGG